MGEHIDPVQLVREMHELGFVAIPLGMPKEGEDDGKAPWVKWEPFQHADSRPALEHLLRVTRKVEDRCDAVAILHGETNGTICVDADSEETRDRLFAAFPDAPWRLRSGKGGHVIFRPPPEVDQRHVRQQLGVEMLLPDGSWVKVDIKPQGGYSIAPGSWHKKRGRRYEPLSPWRAEDKSRLPVLDGSTLTRQKSGLVRSIMERAIEHEAAEERLALQELQPRARVVMPSGSTTEGSLVDRARSYLARVAPAVSGQGGNTATFLAAVAAVRGFDLSDAEAFEVLWEWNQTCIPPWSERDLRLKIRSAREQSTAPFRYILDRPVRGRAPEEPAEPEEPPPDWADDAPWRHTEPPPDGPPEEPPPEGRRARKGPMMDWPTRRRLIAFGRANLGAPKKSPLLRLARRLRKAGNCLLVAAHKDCPCHGPKGVRARPCNDDLFCPNCAHRERMVIEECVRTRWPERVYLKRIDVSGGDRAALRAAREAEWARIRAKAGKHAEMPRYVEGTDHLLVIYPGRFRLLCEVVHPDAVLVTREEAAPLVGAAWHQACELASRFVAGHDLLDLLDFQWFSFKHARRTSSGREIGAELPWTSVQEECSAAYEAWQEAHPGLTMERCDTVVATPDGPRFCGALMRETLFYEPTGQILGERDGSFPELAVTRLLNNSDAERRFVEAEGELAFSAPP